jgi:SAM-dependent methyltransferase
MAYQHPLAYLLGLEGVALLRAYTGEHDRAFVEARFAEIRSLLDAPELQGDGVDVDHVGAVDGYAWWAPTYDTPENGLFALDVPTVREILTNQAAGTVLDAACGTGRLSAVAAEAGHRVVGVDTSAEMLEKARKRVPNGEFHVGDIHDLPIDDHEVDIIVCGLALVHVRDLTPVLREFARVLRPGGHLVISDVHAEHVGLGMIPPVETLDGKAGRIESYRHTVGDYLRAALPLGLVVKRCDEVSVERPRNDSDVPVEKRATSDPLDLGPWEAWPWSLADLVPEAVQSAMSVPNVIVLHFTAPDS